MALQQRLASGWSDLATMAPGSAAGTYVRASTSGRPATTGPCSASPSNEGLRASSSAGGDRDRVVGLPGRLSAVRWRTRLVTTPRRNAPRGRRSWVAALAVVLVALATAGCLGRSARRQGRGRRARRDPERRAIAGRRRRSPRPAAAGDGRPPHRPRLPARSPEPAGRRLLGRRMVPSRATSGRSPGTGWSRTRPGSSRRRRSPLDPGRHLASGSTGGPPVARMDREMGAASGTAWRARHGTPARATAAPRDRGAARSGRLEPPGGRAVRRRRAGGLVLARRGRSVTAARVSRRRRRALGRAGLVAGRAQARAGAAVALKIEVCASSGSITPKIFCSVRRWTQEPQLSK